MLDLIIEDRCPIDKILVVTFTEKATAELRGRIRALLEATLSDQVPADSREEYQPRLLNKDELRSIQDALFSFDSAPIFTIHGFCERVLTELAFEAGTPFRRRVVDGRRAFHRAFRAELRERFAVEPALSALLKEYLAREDKSDRDDMVAGMEKLLWEAHFHRYLDCPAAERKSVSALVEAGIDPKAALETGILDTFLPSIEARLAREKRERGEIDYDDMLVWVARALEQEHADAMLSKLRARFRYALIDEFQDTDYLQWRIFRRAFLESDGKTRLFLVGDPKQAIYAFRGADVYAYLAAKRELTQQYQVAPVPLVRNFRSTGDLIEALNLILDQTAAPPLFSGEIQYNNPALCGREDLRASSSGAAIRPVTLMRYVPDEKAVARKFRLALGRYIAGEIRALLNDANRAITVAQGSAQRAPAASDIFVLTRSWKESIEIGGYLREAGVPFAFYKLDGLFQTDEALDILEVLRAVAEPSHRSRILKAWSTRFFAVPLETMFGLDDIGTDSPLVEWLHEWHALAEQEKFPELFDRMLYQSGLTNRELFLANGERELTNYQHILEVLLTDALNDRLSLEEIIERLSSYHREIAMPPGVNGNVQRVESDRGAVQVMSVHMSKGLQADVVFLFGGTGKTPATSKVCVYHEDGRPVVAVRSALSKAATDRIKEEERHEDERLTYVGITRARVKLYLPVLPAGARVTGYYKRLNQRLLAMLDDTENGFGDLFEVQEIRDAAEAAQSSALDQLLKSWTPPDQLFRGDRQDTENTFKGLRQSHRAMVTRSYTSLSRRAKETVPEPEDFKQDVDGGSETADLAGGRSVGIFLHEVIEKLDFATLADPVGLIAWRERSEVKELFLSTMRRRGVADPKWFERGTEMIFNALRATIHLSDAVTVGPLFRFGDAPREMEFIYPIPQRAHPLLGSASGENWLAERGYLKGFVDFVFEQNGKTYFADWKSDHLDDYDPEAVRAHVTANYAMQARIYSVGVIRLLQIRSEAEYDARFGGLLYVFLRAMRAGGSANGVYFHRPSWNEVVGYEKELMGVAAEPGGGL